MVKKVMEYEDFNGNIRKDTIWFNIGKGELMKWGTSQLDRLIDLVRMMGEESSGQKVVEFISELIDMSYGIKSEDGSHFYKSEKILEDFKMTNAYSELYFELVSDANKAVEFVNGIIPKGILDIKNDPVYKAKQEAINKAISDGDIVEAKKQILSSVDGITQSTSTVSVESEVVQEVSNQPSNLVIL